MKNIKILDCTLRDGGYINEWSFETHQVETVLNLLLGSNIDFIELGFLTKEKKDNQTALFDNFYDINKIASNFPKEKLCLMVEYSKFPSDEIIKNSPIKNIRVIFKKENKKEALLYCKKLTQNNFKVFINPTYINKYSTDELCELIKDINNINPYAMTIVDTLGMLNKNSIKKLYLLIDYHLNKNINLGFHAHDNLGLAFLNAQTLIDLTKERSLIIDTSIFGMGRGAGNIQSELLAKYLNDNFNSNYNILSILKAIREEIEPIYNKTPWGATMPFYLAAIYECHPDYAKFLAQKNLSPDKINSILKNIPKSKRTSFDLNCIHL